MCNRRQMLKLTGRFVLAGAVGRRIKSVTKTAMTRMCNRRQMLKLTGRFVLAGAVGPNIAFSAESDAPGLVAGQLSAAEVGNKVLREGGNAIDAAVAAALTAGVAVPNGCGIGGYGGHMVIALASGKKITAVDFNTAAPAAARPNMFPIGEGGAVRGHINEHGWLSAGVPGTLAGLQLALDRYGTRSFRELVAPAVRLAEEGFPVSEGLARGIRAMANQLRKDPGSARLLFRSGQTAGNPRPEELSRSLLSWRDCPPDRGGISKARRPGYSERYGRVPGARGGTAGVQVGLVHRPHRSVDGRRFDGARSPFDFAKAQLGQATFG
ncbi:MAG: hypothetical protein DME19_01795, partial [Verrucomicrobia bacterium]